MTEKELLYMEDAVSHQDIIISVCEDAVNNIEDEDIKSFISNEIEKHNSIKEGLISLLEAKANE